MKQKIMMLVMRIQMTQHKSDGECKQAGRNHKEFSIQVIISEQPFGLGHGFNKKKAEQSAAEKTCVMLEI
jgi:dsRNA-specific ribonuclease